MEQVWIIESQRFSALAKGQKISWLAKLMYLLSMVARDFQPAGGGSFAEPEKMRRYNEIMHKIIAHQLAVLQNERPQMSDDVLLETIADELRGLGVDVEHVAKNLQRFNIAKL